MSIFQNPERPWEYLDICTRCLYGDKDPYICNWHTPHKKVPPLDGHYIPNEIKITLERRLDYNNCFRFCQKSMWDRWDEERRGWERERVMSHDFSLMEDYRKEREEIDKKIEEAYNSMKDRKR